MAWHIPTDGIIDRHGAQLGKFCETTRRLQGCGRLQRTNHLHSNVNHPETKSWLGHSSITSGRQMGADHRAKRHCRLHSGVKENPSSRSDAPIEPCVAWARDVAACPLVLVLLQPHRSGMTTTLCPSLPHPAVGPIKHKVACGKVAKCHLPTDAASFPETPLLLRACACPLWTHHSNDSEIGTRCATQLVAGALVCKRGRG